MFLFIFVEGLEKNIEKKYYRLHLKWRRKITYLKY